MRGPVKLWMATIVIGVVLKSSIIDAKIIKYIKLAQETQFRDMKAGSLNKSYIIFGCLHTVMSQQSPSNDQFNTKATDNTIEKSRWIKE